MIQISLPLRLQLSLIIVMGTAFLKYHTWSNLFVYGAIALVWVYL
ncbi:MAG: energy-coupling factor transporter transmembrane protein EcfT, partial [Dolichospermum sp.]